MLEVHQAQLHLPGTQGSQQCFCILGHLVGWGVIS